MFLFVGFVWICKISAPKGALLRTFILRVFSRVAYGENQRSLFAKRGKVNLTNPMLLFVRFELICKISAPKGALLRTFILRVQGSYKILGVKELFEIIIF